MTTVKYKVIKETDISSYEKQLEELHEKYEVKDVQTHTESFKDNNYLVVLYIAVVKYLEVSEEVSVDTLNFSGRTSNALWRARIETVNQLKEAMYTGRIKRVRNLGEVSIKEIENKLKELD